MTWLGYLAAGAVLGGFLWVPAGMVLAAILHAAGEADRQSEETRHRVAEAEAQDHRDLNESIYIRRPAARPDSYRRN